jgi:hypothetical protein
MRGGFMKKILSVFVLFVLLIGVQTHATEELTPEKRMDIAKLLSINGALKVANIMAHVASQQMISAIQKVRPDISSDIFEVIKDETRRVIDDAISEKGGLIDLMVPIYHRCFTHDEIMGLISCYSTPLGMKVVEVMPVMMQEGMTAGQQWAQQLGPVLEERIKARLQKEGINI